MTWNYINTERWINSNKQMNTIFHQHYRSPGANCLRVLMCRWESHKQTNSLAEETESDRSEYTFIVVNIDQVVWEVTQPHKASHTGLDIRKVTISYIWCFTGASAEITPSHLSLLLSPLPPFTWHAHNHYIVLQWLNDFRNNGITL